MALLATDASLRATSGLISGSLEATGVGKLFSLRALPST